MDTLMLDRAHLEIVRELHRQGSVTAAAERLHLSQSALSHSMKKLERQMGVPVWEREGRGLRLTQAGEHLLDVSSRVLPQMEQADQALADFARGSRGSLHIGMECHPCYQWLLKLVGGYLQQWRDVDVDVKQKFRFGGLAALLEHEIDLLVTPDPTPRPDLTFEPVFDYEQVLVVGRDHPLAREDHIEPQQLADQILITYPIDIERLDIYNYFLNPAGVSPRSRKVIESTDLMMQMVAVGRGVAALPRWLVEENAGRMGIAAVRLGAAGVPKQIHLGVRSADLEIRYMKAFIDAARMTPREAVTRASEIP
jgi:LysR family transcriptional regulator, regulator for metE and metH